MYGSYEVVVTISGKFELSRFFEEYILRRWSRKMRHREIRSRDLDFSLWRSRFPTVLRSCVLSLFIFLRFVPFCFFLFCWSTLFCLILRFRFDLHGCGKILVDIRLYRWKFSRLTISAQFASRLVTCNFNRMKLNSDYSNSARYWGFFFGE